jgi:hypothetical protein
LAIAAFPLVLGEPYRSWSEEMALNRRRLLIYSATLIVLSFATYYVGATIYVWWHIPEAYAAWDAGLLLVRHMEKHQGDWPDSWSDLEHLYRDEPHMRLYWNPQEPDYFDRMREMIAINWDYDTGNRTPANPVTSSDGTPLVCLWANPNFMIAQHLDADRKSQPKSVVE